MKKLVFVFALALLSVGFTFPQISFACSCMIPGSPQEEMERSAFVFSGTVQEISMSSPETPFSSFIGGMDVTFEIREIWKGDMSPQFTVQTAMDSASCGYNFTEGEAYLVYGNIQDGFPTVSLCSRTQLLSAADEDVTALGESSDPAPEVSTPDESTPDAPPAGITPAQIGMIVLAGGILVFLLWYIRLPAGRHGPKK